MSSYTLKKYHKKTKEKTNANRQNPYGCNTHTHIQGNLIKEIKYKCMVYLYNFKLFRII